MLKKLLISLVLGFTIVPIPSVQALTMLDNPTEALVYNVVSAKSADYRVNIDVETDNDDLALPVTLHVDFDGQTDVDGNSRFNTGYRLHTDTGESFSSGMSAILTPTALYFSENKNEWYILDIPQNIQTLQTEGTENDGQALADAVQEMFDYGVITYQAERVEFVNGKMTVKYTYAVQNDRLTEFLVEKEVLTLEQAEELLLEYGDKLSLQGAFWVDTVAILPVRFTMVARSASSDTSYTQIKVEILFDSFNSDALIKMPAHPMSIDEYQASDSNQTIFTNASRLTALTDSDSDGLSDVEERNVWHSNPFSSDTDGDGYPDYTEVINGYDPNGVGKLDSDGDELTDYAELTIHWTDRYNADSDGDGYPDGLEVANGYDPNGPGRF